MTLNVQEEAEQWITCPYCLARPRIACHTITGRPTTPHSARVAPILNAFRTGWLDGYEIGKRAGARRAIKR